MRLRCIRIWKHRIECRGEGGFSLIESIIAVAIIGTTVLALVTAMITLLLSTNSNKKIVFSGVQLTSIAETVRKMPYVACEDKAALKSRLNAPSVSSLLPDYVYDVESVTFVDSRTNDSPGFQDKANCLATGDNGVQRIELKVSSTGAPNISERLVLHKRNDACPVGVGSPGQRC